MKVNNKAKQAALLALMGLLQISTAQGAEHKFIPLEQLPPEQRIILTEKLNNLLKDVNIDWDEIVVGVDENGKLTLKLKSECEMRELSSPSSFAAKASTEDDK